jgi:3-dehydroquinate dehydratase-1
MDSLGADIPKVAYMPQGEEDVHAVIQAAHAASEFCDKPFIALSMGEEGLPSRICSGASGSAVTFASLSGQSAPGQINVSDMRALLKEFYSK